MISTLKEIWRDVTQSMQHEWAIENAPPIDFGTIEGLNDTERESLEKVYDNFRNDALNGILDTQAQSQLKHFLTHQGFDPCAVEKALRELRAINDQSIAGLRHVHDDTQDRYWQATGLTDTRVSEIYSSIRRDY